MLKDIAICPRTQLQMRLNSYFQDDEAQLQFLSDLSEYKFIKWKS